MKKMFFGSDMGIDLGTATVLVYVKGYGIVLKEPSVVAIDKNTHTVLAVGEEARQMLGKTPVNIAAVRPLRDGVISDYDVTEKMLKFFIEKSVGRHFFLRPKIAVCVPSKVTGVEKRAVEDATREAGAREVYIIEEPVAAAIGAGVDISKASGSMVVDIGGGTCDVAVISLGGIVVSDSIKMAGDKFDEAIVRYIRTEHQLLIGERTAEQMKITIGTAYPREEEVCMDVKGRDLMTGLPKTIMVSSNEILEALRECTSMITDTIKTVLEETPPELSADISNRGIMLTGGGSMLYGLDKLITKETGIKAYYGAEDPISCVAIGTGKYIEFQTEKRKGKRWRLW
ncbi:MAG: rod shape-determining protein MreB [Clostridiales bacterium]|nr:rod shape-determining protein MreB [Clostridiales bacterium]